MEIYQYIQKISLNFTIRGEEKAVAFKALLHLQC